MASIDKITAPYMKKQQTWIDKRGLKRQVPMKVLCLGLSRTGTSSMRVALWSLGYEAYHGWSLFENPPDGTLWQEAMAAKFKGEGNVWGRKEFDSIFYDSDACLDVPSNNFARELIEAYPDAKVVMTTRDVDSWHQSCMDTIFPASSTFVAKLITHLDPAIALYLPALRQSMTYYYDDDFPKHGKRRFKEHYAMVKEIMASKYSDEELPNHYLEFSVTEGYGPLCKFLGEDVPVDEATGEVKPFPKLNDRKDFDATFGPYFRDTFLWQVGTRLKWVAVPVVGFLAWKMYSRR